MDDYSDSSDTIILSPDRNIDIPSDDEVENILKKYASTSSSLESNTNSISRNRFYELSDDELIDIPSIKKVKRGTDEFSSTSSSNQDDIHAKLLCKYSSSSAYQSKITLGNELIVLSDNSDSELNLESNKVTTDKRPNDGVFGSSGDEQLETLSPRSRARVKKKKDAETKKAEKAREKEKKKEEAENRKAMKNIEREKKKEAAEQQKALRAALKTVERSNNREECIKNITVDIDNENLEAEYGAVLRAALQSNDISFKSSSQLMPKLISWRRKLQTIEDMLVKDSEVNEKYFLLIMSLDEFTKTVNRNLLTKHIKETMGITCCKQLSVAVFGADKVKGDLDFAVTEAQFHTKCYFRFVKRSEDLAAFVIELTKAVAQVPYKLKKEEKHMLQSEYFNDCNKDTVRVDKNGNGLGRLWQQMLTMFPLARLETAEAITAVYPTPSSLFKAYKECATQKEKMIQDLPIRRAIGPCASVRRIGPELSRKCYNFFCSTENILL